MKKLFIFALLGAFAFQINAQSMGDKEFNQPGNIYIIPKIGYNMANISKIKSDPRHGINVGVSAEYIVTDMFALEAGLYYSMQGASWKLDQGDLNWLEKISGSASATLKNDYINIPVFLKAYVSDGFHIFAGPQVGFLVNTSVGGKAKLWGFEWRNNSVSTTIDKYVKDYEKKVDFSVVIGAGYQDKSGFLISANYNVGVTKLFEMDMGSQNYLDFNARNNVLQINVGYRF